MIHIHKHKIELITFSDIHEFVNIASKAIGTVQLIDDKGFCVNGKSLLGTIATVEWGTLYCISESDIYSSIQKFCVA